MTFLDAAEIGGAIVAIIAACYALLRVGESLWNAVRKVQETVDHIGLVPKIRDRVEGLHESVDSLTTDAAALLAEQQKVASDLANHVGREEEANLGRDGRLAAADKRLDAVEGRLGGIESHLGTIDTSLTTIAGWRPPPAEA